jgi:hypothetical protein
MVVAGVLLLLAAPTRAVDRTARIDVHVESDEARAVLAILEKRASGGIVAAEDWSRLWRSEGYVRLSRRERSMGRSFEDSAFRAFVASDSLLARRTDLARTLAAWEAADPSAAAARALAYLPAGARIHATIYPVIKPRDNSFVFEVDTDPAIFLYLDPTRSAAQFENTLAHELHHIGYGTVCKGVTPRDSLQALAVRWMGAFGEGMAMLAAAGGPDVHPHAVSPRADRARWDRDMQKLPADVRSLEGFFGDVLEGRITGGAVTERAMGFFGVQGPWYTVGWAMASSIERAFGRNRLLSVLCDPRQLLRTYNQAATSLDPSGGKLPRWSDAFLARLRD